MTRYERAYAFYLARTLILPFGRSAVLPEDALLYRPTLSFSSTVFRTLVLVEVLRPTVDCGRNPGYSRHSHGSEMATHLFPRLTSYPRTQSVPKVVYLAAARSDVIPTSSRRSSWRAGLRQRRRRRRSCISTSCFGEQKASPHSC